MKTILFQVVSGKQQFTENYTIQKMLTQIYGCIYQTLLTFAKANVKVM